MLPLLAVSAVVALSAVGVWLYKRKKSDAQYSQILEQTLTNLQTLSEQAGLTQELQRQVSFLLTQGRAYSKVIQERPPEEKRELTEKISTAGRQLANFVQAAKPSKSGWTQGLLKSKNWGLSGSGASVQDLFHLLQELNGTLLATLRITRKSSPAQDNGMEERMNAYEDSARLLLGKVEAVAQEPGQYMESIAMTAFDMVRSMREDPDDQPPGDKFLNRYLNAAHKIADEYIRLTAEKNKNEEVNAALKRSVEVLQRLEVAFKDEHAGMLQNDSVRFTAELNALDAMLKMGGH